MNSVKTFLTSVVFLAAFTACGARPIPNASTTTAVQATGVPSTMTAPITSTTTGGMAGMDHGSASMNEPFDAMFIDGMIKHHQGAIDMAKEAQQKASKPEIRQLAVAIVQSQQAEIDQMNGWRKQWYPDLPQTSGMEMDMAAMNVSEGAEPYDVRFIAAMIPHHESAITMAQQATQRAEHPELKTLASEIITAQTDEIVQMKQWYQAWTGKPYASAMTGMDHSSMAMSGDLNIAFSTEPTELKASRPGVLVIMLTDKDGKPVEDAQVKLSLSMTTMDMGAMAGSATDEGGGRYTIKTNFDHGGNLKITVEATKDTLTAKQEFEIEAN